MRTAEILDRIASKFLVGDGCWEWTAAKNQYGYGVVRIDSKNKLAHVVLYELMVGPVPDGLELDHTCRRRNCVRPLHLEPVTHRENVLRGESMMARRARQTHCHNGHAYDEENTYYHPDRGTRDCKACAKERRQRRARHQ